MPTDNIFITSSDVYLNNQNIAVSAFSVNYGLNAVGSAVLNLALGTSFSATKPPAGILPGSAAQQKVVNPENIKAGDTVDIFHTQTNKVTGDKVGGHIFSGIVSGVGASFGEGGQGTSISTTISCTHRLCILGGLPTFARAFIMQNTANRVYDNYRDIATAPISAIAAAIQGLENSRAQKPYNAGIFVIEILKALYKSEENLVAKFGRVELPEVLRVLNTLKISPNMISNSPEGKAANILLTNHIQNILRQGWLDNNGLQLMFGILNSLFAGVIPTPASGYIAPMFPLSKIPSLTVSTGKIFNLRKESTIATQQVVGVRLNAPDRITDVQMDASDGASLGGMITQWPPDSDLVSGIYEYVQMPQWAEIVKNYYVGKASPPSSVTKKSDPGGDPTLTPPAAAEPPSPAQVDAWLLNVAKTIFMTKKWSRNSLDMSVPFSFNTAPGAVVRLNLYGSVGSNIFGGKELFGQVMSVSISASYTGVSCTAKLGFVRNKVENDKYGFDEHPLYTGYKMERLNLF